MCWRLQINGEISFNIYINWNVLSLLTSKYSDLSTKMLIYHYYRTSVETGKGSVSLVIENAL